MSDVAFASARGGAPVARSRSTVGPGAVTRRSPGTSKSSCLHLPVFVLPSERRRRKPKAPPPYDPVKEAQARVDKVDLERHALHQRVVVRPRRNEKKPQIEILLRQNAISKAQFDAAERLLRCWQGSGFNQRLVADYDGSGGGRGAAAGPPSGPTAVMFSRALSAVGHHLARVLIAVVIEDQAAKAWAESRGYDEADGIAILRMALTELARHFGLGGAGP